MDFDSLSPEYKEKARACKSEEELEELAKTMGAKLSKDQLEVVAGGDQGGICRKDYPCQAKEVRPPCPSDGCPGFIEDVIQNCTNVVPTECTELVF